MNVPMKPGEIVAGKYRLKHRLGIGGMGEVWATQHTATGRDFAIKFMHPHVAASDMARQRFSREARASARINHPNIIDVFDVGELEEGALFLVMELLDGISLADSFYVTPPLSARDFVSIMLDTARAMAAAHAVGIIHRDIKPGNIFLHRDRVSGLAYAKLLDFGISKFGGNDDAVSTKTGSVLGSPRYMSPEQARSAAAADHRADIWSMGVILFEGLAGTWPHDGDSFSSLVVAIATTPPLSIDTLAPHLPVDLRCIIRDCLQPIEYRLATAGELAARLEAALQNESLTQIPLPRPARPPGDARSFTTGGNLRIGQSPSSPPRPGGATGPPGTLPQPFGVPAQPRPAVTTAESAALTVKQPFGPRGDEAARALAGAAATIKAMPRGPMISAGGTIPMHGLATPVPGPPQIGLPVTGVSPPSSATQPNIVPRMPGDGEGSQPGAPMPTDPAGRVQSAPGFGPSGTLAFITGAPGGPTTPAPNAARRGPTPAAPDSLTVPNSPDDLRARAGLMLPAGYATAAGSTPRDPLSGSVSSAVATIALDSESRRAPPEALSTLPSARHPPSTASPRARRFGGPLGIAAAVLAVLAVIIGVALVSVIRSTGAPVAVVVPDPSSGPTVAPAAPVVEPGPPLAPPPPADPTAPSASASPSSAVSAAPAASSARPRTPRTGPATKPSGDKSRVEKLGSGLD
jgi:serine/threonine-protein kinase